MKIGDKVVCVSENWKHPMHEKIFTMGQHPKLNEIYVIEEMMILDGDLCYKFVGIECYETKSGRWIAWISINFRKLEDIKEINKLKNEINSNKELENP